MQCRKTFLHIETGSNQIYLVTLRPTQLTQASFLQKKNHVLQNVFFIPVMLRWHSGVKNHEIWTFQVKKLLNLSKKNFIEEYQFRTTFFVKYIF